MDSTTYSRFIDAPSAAGSGIAPRGKRACVFEAAGSPRQEVGVERHDHVGLVEVIDRLEVFAESQPATCPNGVARDRFVSVPFRLGKLLDESPQLVGQGRRGDRLGQDAQAGAFFRAKRFADVESEASGSAPRFRPGRCASPAASGPGRRGQHRRPGRRCRLRPGWPDDQGCPRS